VRQTHKRPQRELSGTHLSTEANKERAAYEREQYSKRKTAGAQESTESRICLVPRKTSEIGRYTPQHNNPSLIAASSSSGSGADQIAMTMIRDIHTFVAQQTENKNWADTVPEVRMKGKYVNAEIPTAKGEGVGRGYWPTSLKKDRIKLPEFEARLQKVKGKAAGEELTGAAYKTYMGASRVMGCLEIVSKPGQGIHNQLHMQSRVDLFYKCQIQ